MSLVVLCCAMASCVTTLQFGGTSVHDTARARPGKDNARLRQDLYRARCHLADPISWMGCEDERMIQNSEVRSTKQTRLVAAYKKTDAQ